MKMVMCSMYDIKKFGRIKSLYLTAKVPGTNQSNHSYSLTKHNLWLKLFKIVYQVFIQSLFYLIDKREQFF